ncbi:dol-P-Man:Man(7)GlcNAc(2)-PP-Dol alpha-1,6-mannosyltransferase isoform X3 [Macadamia integrifolia]|uniref:dol-P-Man:Man(7)GlcNAc(2)-PP-Dol alpha-1,6-mannosyltransferase isoform X3 n=1 Tax=Macadamia integrifolia TaxID=60698 RepID=UPI001C4F29D7|nr:dol-P-Man:Man(7)GlcNAc(2)-PP-Dol alpha-1,6-mannosyltransferase isoform X3 [Macadamia integrifolia]
MNYNKSSKFLELYGWDLLLGSIAAFYVFMAPFTKVEESFNVQAMHDILYHGHHLEKYDHLEFPGVVPRTFIGAFLGAILASPVVLLIRFLDLPKLCSLLVVNLAYGFWFKGSFHATLCVLVCATVIFRCDMLLLLGPIGLEVLLTRSISLWEALKSCVSTSLLCIGFTIVVDTIMWRRFVWPEFEVLWFNSVLNQSSQWGTYAFHWYFTSALPRSLLAAYPLFVLGMFLDRRISGYIVPVLSFVLLYSKLPHKELRFIIGSTPMLNVAAAVAASRIYNNRKKAFWKWLNIMMLGSLLASLGCSIIMFLASYDNYPAGYALKALHQIGLDTVVVKETWVHIDSFSAMNGISRFSENDFPWRYSKEEGIAMEEFRNRNFTYLLNEHADIDGFKCLFSVKGFSKARLHIGFPPIFLLKEPKVFIHGNMRSQDALYLKWPGCKKDII